MRYPPEVLTTSDGSGTYSDDVTDDHECVA
jgi:hypothetical protein